MKFLRQLMEARPFLERVPDQTIIVNALGTNNRIQATRGKNYIFIYSSQGQTFVVNADKISGSEIKAYWYDPRKGTAQSIGTFSKKAQQEFTAPTSGYGQDWVLVIDDASKNFAVPGSR
jgi:hypothetical protein